MNAETKLPAKPAMEARPRPLWLPPLVSLATLFAIFLTAMAVRRSPIADAGRPVMIALSAIAAAGIALFGIKMMLETRIRGIASAIAGAVMVALGIYTALHVLR